MKNITRTIIAALAFISAEGYAQTAPVRQFGQRQFEPCGTTEYESQLQQKYPSRPDTQQFEEWLAPKVASVRAKRLMKNGMNTNAVVTLPVVVHVIHNGDAIGEGENITDAQVMSQITVLNQDFRKMAGTPGHNTNPVGADTEIQFCLAQRDPQGNISTGIVRHVFGWNTMTRSHIELLKTLTQWDPEKYINIWVVRSIMAEGGMPLLGYAQFPTNSGLPGLSFPGLPTAANTDGIVMAYEAFGSSDIYPQGSYFPGKDKGHTCTHEMGHFLGLRHVWGDVAGCQGNDFCNDTPVIADANSGCPPSWWDSCPASPGLDMFQNYMDYTDDACQNIFTLDQKDRMMAVLQNSPRRASLITSDGCMPGVVSQDEGSLEIMNINAQCNTYFEPQVTLVNTGSTTITSAAIVYQVNDGTEQVYNWQGSIAPGQQAVITMPMTGAGPGNNTYSVRLQLVNGQADAVPDNDIRQRNFTIASTYDTSVVRVKIMADAFTQETLWWLRNSNGTVVGSGQGAPLLSGQEVTVNVNVAENECYTFEITDSMGDGICCGSGFGYYRLETADGWIIAEGGEFGDSEIVRFRTAGTMGSEGFSLLSNARLYPNPASNMLNITVPDGAALPEGYAIYNSLGQVVATGKMISSVQAIDVAAFAKGIYFVKLSAGDSTATLRFIKE